MCKKLIFVAVLAAVWVGAAATVSYSIPVLTVKSNEAGVIRGSGRLNKCPFSFIETTNAVPVKVAIAEDMPSGAGNELRASLWLAVTTAALSMNHDLAGVVVNCETTGYVDGPSAGGMFCLAVMSAIEGKSFPEDFAMTGTIMADGTIGAVGGVAEKLRAAKKAGVKRICIPAFTRLDEDFTDLLDLGEKLGLEMHQVSTIAEAYQVLHRLPSRPTMRLNPVEVCRLSSLTDQALKGLFVKFFNECPASREQWNKETVRACEEYRAGSFGAAVMDLKDALENYSEVAGSVETPDVERYPALAQEFPTNGVPVASSSTEKAPTRAQYEAALKAFHQDLKRGGSQAGEEDDLESEEPEGKGKSTGGKKPDAQADWFEDYVESPVGEQLVTLANNHNAKLFFWRSVCDKVTRDIDAVEDWDQLEIEQLNEIRSQLLLKQNLLSLLRSFNPGAENYERAIALDARLYGSLPFIRPNASVRQVENVFYRTMMAMHAALSEGALKDDRSWLVCVYDAVLNAAENAHEKAADESGRLKAIFSEVDALSFACAFSMCKLTDSQKQGSGNLAFYSSVVSTARENALVNIAECRKAGIPCVMPVLEFQAAEFLRDDATDEDDVETQRLDVLADYLHASLSAKALSLCFRGCKLELNAKGYCSKSVTIERLEDNMSNRTVKYFGTDGRPILRDGFSGYIKTFENGKLAYTSWLDLGGRAVRLKTTNEWWSLTYDASGRRASKTYCNASWKPTPNKDGVLFETFGYDAAGNWNDWELFGVASNRMVCAEGFARIKSQYNKRGKEVWRRYYGAQNEPVVHKDGNAGIDFVYDKKGNLRRSTYVDLKGNPVMTVNGYAWAESKYDGAGHEIERSWHDAQGGLVNVKGIAKFRYEYDENGNMTVVACFGADDKLTRGTDTWAILRRTFNRSNVLTEVRCYGTDGKPVLCNRGWFGWKTIFDEAGREAGCQYYDLDGNEVEPQQNRQPAAPAAKPSAPAPSAKPAPAAVQPAADAPADDDIDDRFTAMIKRARFTRPAAFPRARFMVYYFPYEQAHHRCRLCGGTGPVGSDRRREGRFPAAA